ncbi:MAG: hypothetical protein E6892_00625, partial [Streptococcus mitis]|nr:hypothetical protein [Streptococcus mitis]MDU1469582.1 hypothetical protein [Streptococcus mitis]
MDSVEDRFTSNNVNIKKESLRKAFFLVFYVTISPSRSARCETKKPPAMRVRVEGYTPKTP